jgi:DNA polymerase-1
MRQAPIGSLQQMVIDVMALTGDASDNVPGAPGIGKKTAAKLIQRWGSLDALIISARTGYTDQVLTPRLAKIISDNLEMILLSRELVRLDR